MPPRSLCVHSDWIETVNQSYESAYKSSRCPNQKDFADRIPVSHTKVGLSIDTLNNFRQGKRVDRENFYALCDRLGLKAEQITVPRLETKAVPEAPPRIALDVTANEHGGELTTVPPIIDAEYADAAEAENQSRERPKEVIRQKVGTLKQIAVGYVDEYNRKSGQSSPGKNENDVDAGKEAAFPSVQDQPTDLEIYQEVNVVEKTAPLIGRAKRIYER